MLFNESSVNYLAVLVSSVVAFIVGWLWYGPLFGKAWMSEMKIKPDPSKMKGMWKTMLINFIATLATACVIANFIIGLSLGSYTEALQFGFMVWLGFFAAATLLGGVLWEGKTWKYYWIGAFYWLVNLCLMSVILTLWK